MSTNNPLHPSSARAIGMGERSQAIRPAGLIHREIEDVLLHAGIPGTLHLIADILRQARHECTSTDRAKPLALQAQMLANLATVIAAIDDM